MNYRQFYVMCPLCKGSGFLNSGIPCEYCYGAGFIPTYNVVEACCEWCGSLLEPHYNVSGKYCSDFCADEADNYDTEKYCERCNKYHSIDNYEHENKNLTIIEEIL